MSNIITKSTEVINDKIMTIDHNFGSGIGFKIIEIDENSNEKVLLEMISKENTVINLKATITDTELL